MHALCFGEILWDFLPDGLFPGGAPFNVAYHLHQHGAVVRLASAVGDDVLGAELRRRLARWGLTTDTVARLADRPTGTVLAHVTPTGDAHYEITADVAWDAIPASPAVLTAARQTDVLIHGSLAQRSAANRATLAQLQAALPAGAWRVFDVNLRPPHDDLALVRELARDATVLKLNAEEASRLAGLPAAPGRADEEPAARELARATGASMVCITAGARGAGLLREGRWSWEPGRPITVADTVGAGDAFLAALVTHLQAGAETSVALARACRLGEWVASRRGGTPAYDTKL